MESEYDPLRRIPVKLRRAGAKVVREGVLQPKGVSPQDNVSDEKRTYVLKLQETMYNWIRHTEDDGDIKETYKIVVPFSARHKSKELRTGSGGCCKWVSQNAAIPDRLTKFPLEVFSSE